MHTFQLHQQNVRWLWLCSQRYTKHEHRAKNSGNSRVLLHYFFKTSADMIWFWPNRKTTFNVSEHNFLFSSSKFREFTNVKYCPTESSHSSSNQVHVEIGRAKIKVGNCQRTTKRRGGHIRARSRCQLSVDSESSTTPLPTRGYFDSYLTLCALVCVFACVLLTRKKNVWANVCL